MRKTENDMKNTTKSVANLLELILILSAVAWKISMVAKTLVKGVKINEVKLNKDYIWQEGLF